MKSHKLYTEHSHKVVVIGDRFEHVMALALDKCDTSSGIIRCIVDRTGDVEVAGYIDRSQLFIVNGSLHKYEILQKLHLTHQEEIIERLSKKHLDFVGLEDPDIFYDEQEKLYHLYFTMAFISPDMPSEIHMGHAVGKSLESLKMTMPVLRASSKHLFAAAKEVSIAPLNSKGFRYNLFESGDIRNKLHYSVVRVSRCRDLGERWNFGEVVFHPADYTVSWIGGHASPGPLLPESFIGLGPGLRLGIMNGRELDKVVIMTRKYGKFSVGLFIYNYEKGYIEWISDDYLIRDSEAKTITFASEFVETVAGEGLLYAHVDDSFVRAYTIKARDLVGLLPSKFLNHTT